MKKRICFLLILLLITALFSVQDACADEPFRITFSSTSVEAGSSSTATIETLDPNVTVLIMHWCENLIGFNDEDSGSWGGGGFSFDSETNTATFRATSNWEGWFRITYQDKDGQEQAFESERIQITNGAFAYYDTPAVSEYVPVDGTYTVTYTVKKGAWDTLDAQPWWWVFTSDDNYIMNDPKIELTEDKTTFTATFTPPEDAIGFDFGLTLYSEYSHVFHDNYGVGHPVTRPELWSEPHYYWSEDNSTVDAVREYDSERTTGYGTQIRETAETTSETIPATETEDGKIIYTAEFKRAEFETQTKEVVIPALGHTLTAHPEVEATCTEPGTEAYWSCDVCGKLFSDDEATVEIEAPVVIPAAGHTEVVDPEVPATPLKAGRTEGKHCSVCGKTLVKQKKIPIIKGKYKAPDGTVYDVNKTSAAYKKPAKSSASITIPDTIDIGGVTVKITSIADKAFCKDKKLKTVTIGKNVKSIGKSAFESCTALSTVKGGANVTTVMNSAFQYCRKLSDFPKLSKLQKIGDNAFKSCTAVRSFTIGSKVSAIGRNAFNGCKALKAITIDSKKLTEKAVGANAFKGINSKATIKCPKSKLKAYEKLLLNRGVPKTATIQ